MERSTSAIVLEGELEEEEEDDDDVEERLKEREESVALGCTAVFTSSISISTAARAWNKRIAGLF